MLQRGTATFAGGSTLATSGSAGYSPAPVPSAPVGVQAAGGASKVDLAWTGPVGLNVTFNVYRGTSTNAESGTPLATGISALSYSDTTAVSSTQYFYKISAVNEGGESDLSSEVNATAS